MTRSRLRYEDGTGSTSEESFRCRLADRIDPRSGRAHAGADRVQAVTRVSAIAKELSISESCVRNWKALPDADDTGGSASRLTSAEKRELTEQCKEKRRLEVENDILKRGLGRPVAVADHLAVVHVAGAQRVVQGG